MLQRTHFKDIRILTLESEPYVTTDGQSACLSWNKAPIWGLRPDFITFRQLHVSWCGALSLTTGEICRLQLLLPLPAQSFSGPSPVELAPIFYCLRFETSLFVASYDSQGYGGGIRPRLHLNTWIPSTLYTRIQFVPHGKHITSPLQSPTG
jgi:hypothetical protein